MVTVKRHCVVDERTKSMILAGARRTTQGSASARIWEMNVNIVISLTRWFLPPMYISQKMNVKPWQVISRFRGKNGITFLAWENAEPRFWRANVKSLLAEKCGITFLAVKIRNHIFGGKMWNRVFGRKITELCFGKKITELCFWRKNYGTMFLTGKLRNNVFGGKMWNRVLAGKLWNYIFWGKVTELWFWRKNVKSRFGGKIMELCFWQKS